MLSAAPFLIVGTWVIALLFLPMDKTTIVLMADPDGHVGQVVVSTEGGSQTLSEAGQTTQVTSAEKAPTAVKTLSDDQVARMFVEALAVEPLTPKKFTLYFKPGGIELTPDSVALLPEVVAEIVRRKSADIGVHGHSDRVGAKAYNDQLSLQRAQAVRELLVEQRIDSDLIETASHGEGNPVVPTADNVAEPRNRRVEVVVR